MTSDTSNHIEFMMQGDMPNTSLNQWTFDEQKVTIWILKSSIFAMIVKNLNMNTNG